MFIVGLNLLKRIICYFAISFLWGFLFIGLASFATGYGHIYSYSVDSLLASLVMIISIGASLEVARFIVIKKYNKVKLEIEQDDFVIFDKPANFEMNTSIFEGWLFLTDKNIIFKSLNKKKPQSLFIPLDSIKTIISIKLVAFVVNLNNISYKFVISKRNQVVDLIKSKLPLTTI